MLELGAAACPFDSGRLHPKKYEHTFLRHGDSQRQPDFVASAVSQRTHRIGPRRAPGRYETSRR